MIEKILSKRNFSVKIKITVKTLISLAVVALAVVLPQIVHLFAGAAGGIKFLPMYLPVIIGACLLGWKWGLGIGILSPLTSFLITSAFGNPMPVLTRLPFMIAELSVMAVISGLFSKRISSQAVFSFPAVILSFVVGRAFFMLCVLCFGSFLSLDASLVLSQIQSGMTAVVVQSVLIPLIILGVAILTKNDKNND